MTKRTYSEARHFGWKRYCTPVIGAPPPLREFLPPPDRILDHLWTGGEHPGAVAPVEGVQAARCAVLLAEQGMGKTTVLEGLFRADEAERSRTLWFDLGRVGSEASLRRYLFASPEMQRLRDGRTTLHLYLDSLDEGILGIEHLTDILALELERLPLERLRVRIACRSTHWRFGFQRTLSALFPATADGELGFLAVHLHPLTEADARAAAEQTTARGDAFLAQVHAANLQALAARPDTLNFLLRRFESNQPLPSTRSEAYRLGLRLLLEERNQHRRDRRLAEHLNTAQRMALAGRLACATVLSNRAGLWLGPESEAPEEALVVGDLDTGELRDEDDRVVPVDTESLHDLIDLGPFRSVAPGEMFVWSNRALAEYLAAWHIGRFRVSPEALLPLLTNELVSADPIPQQLEYFAGFLADTHPTTWEILASRAPLSLLRSDLSERPAEDRARLTEGLLEGVATRRVGERPWGEWEHASKLDHEGLADQLSQWIGDRERDFIARRVAVYIGRACQLEALQPQLEAVLLDPSENATVRGHAAIALRDFTGSADTFRALLERPDDFDTDDELRGVALLELWPDGLPQEHRFEVLTTPLSPNTFGVYTRFLTQELPERMSAEDLPDALDWLFEHARFDSDWQVDESVVEAMLALAVDNITCPDVARRVLRLAISDWHQLPRTDGLGAALRGGTAGMWTAVREIATLFSDSIDHASRATFALNQMGVETDDWWGPLVSDKNQTDTIEPSILGELIWLTWDRRNPDVISDLFRKADELPRLRRHLQPLLDLFGTEPADFHRQLCQAADEEQRTWRQKTGGAAEPEPLTPPPADRVEQRLAQIEGGDTALFWDLIRQLWLEPDARSYRVDWEAPLDDSPGWDSADETTRHRIVEAAGAWLRDESPHTELWLDQKTEKQNYGYAVTGMKALELVAVHDLAKFDGLARSIWTTWAPAVVDSTHLVGDPTLADCIRSRSQDQAEETVASTLLELARHPRTHAAILGQKIRTFYSPKVCTALLPWIDAEECPRDLAAAVLAVLVEAGDVNGIVLADHWAHEPSSTTDDERPRRVIAAASLFRYSPQHRNDLLDHFEVDAQFACDVMRELVLDQGIDDTLPPTLDESQAARLFAVALDLAPPREDPDLSSVRAVGPRDMLAFLRNHLLSYLASRGTAAAVKEIEQLIHNHPDLDDLPWSLFEARRRAGMATWQPRDPVEVRQIVEKTAAKLPPDPGSETVKKSEPSIQKSHSDSSRLPDAAPKMENHAQAVRVAHLSDFHFSEERLLDQDEVLAGLVNDLAELVRNGLAPDLVVITGDVANFGLPAEYELARSWLANHLLPAAGVGVDRLFIVPGNHDVRRSAVKSNPELSLAQSELLQRKDPDLVRQFLGSRRGSLLERHDAYLVFLQRLGVAHPQTAWWNHRIRIHGVELLLGGMDSAWMSWQDGEQGNLLLGRTQCQEVFRELAREPADLVLALVHHPWPYIAAWDAAETEEYIREHVGVLLHGHLHQQRTRLAGDPDREHLVLAAGASFSSARWANAWQLLELDPFSGSVHVHFRCWDGVRWIPDRNRYKEAPNAVAALGLRYSPRVPPIQDKEDEIADPRPLDERARYCETLTGQSASPADVSLHRMEPRTPEERAAVRRELRSILLHSLDQAEVDVLLRVVDPEDTLCNELPAAGTRLDRVTEIVRGLEQHGLVGPPFFDELVRLAPAQQARVERVRRRWLAPGALHTAVVTLDEADFSEGFDLADNATADGLLRNLTRRYPKLRRLRHAGRRLRSVLSLKLDGRVLARRDRLPASGVFELHMDVELRWLGRDSDVTKDTLPTGAERAALLREALAP